ncbi:MAG: DUF3842 family protein [Maledivibacter sp.]|nr:DUF3842 family protein [Maledivibacter sp.]
MVKRIAIIDGKGGGIGKVLTEKIRRAYMDDIEIWVFGTNTAATTLMLNAGADDGATGENAIVTSINKVDFVISSLSLVMPNALLGEVTPKIAEAVSSCSPPKILLPLSRGNIHLVGAKPGPLPHLVDEVVRYLKEVI